MRSAIGANTLVAVAVAVLWGSVARGQVASKAGDVRIQISVDARRLWVVAASGDTLLDVPVAVGSGNTLEGEGRSWTFRTPLGRTRVVSKERAPVWIPPDWYYVEIAKERGLRLAWLSRKTPVRLSDGRLLVVRGRQVGILGSDSTFVPFAAGTDVVVDGAVFIPPFDTEQRRIPGILGQHRLNLANGIGLHGTPAKESIGGAATHGCIRLHDEDVAWLYERVPIGTVVVIGR